MTTLKRRGTVTGSLAVALLLGLGCESTPTKPATGGGAVTPAVDAAPAKDPLTTRLVAGKWTGTLGDHDPIEVTFTDGRDGLAAQILFTRFGRPLIREHAKVTVEQPGKVTIKGTRASSLVGKGGPAPVHELTGTLAADGATITGTSPVTGSPKGLQFTVSTTKTLAAVDPPLETARAEAALVDGKWEGKAGDDKAKLVLKRSGARIAGHFVHGDTAIAVEVKPQPNGVVTFLTSPQRSGQRQVTGTFDLAFARGDLRELTGSLKEVTQLGVMMQGQTYAVTLDDRRPPPKGR